MLSMSRKYAANRIRALRKAKGLTMEELGSRMRPEITLATVQKLETGQMGLTLDYINEVARVLDCTPEEVIAPDGAIALRMVPVLGSIAAGNWAEEIELTDEFMPIPADAGGPRSFALRPMGDSMDRLVTSEGFIVVDPDQVDLLDGKAYAVRNGSNEATFKFFFASPPRLEPCSTNPDHVPMPLGREPFLVIGRVVMALSPM
jgi:repressor LexA